MMIGLIGRGPHGNRYAETLDRMGVYFWQAGRDWDEKPEADAYIIASAAYSHYSLAKQLIAINKPVLIEKPVCMSTTDALSLLKLAKHLDGIVFCGHTRLYSPAWKLFKAMLHSPVHHLEAIAGGGAKIDPWWDWGPHLMAMYLDLQDSGVKIRTANIEAAAKKTPLSFDCDGAIFMDSDTDPMPMECLLTQFLAAIKKGPPDIRDLGLAYRVTALLESTQRKEESGDQRKYG